MQADSVTMGTHVFGNLLLPTSPLVITLLSGNTLERHERLSIEITLRVLSSVVGEETVGELIRGGVQREGL